MAWHKWFVRGVVLTIVAGVVLGTLAYQHWTNSASVRAQVIAKFSELFPGAAVSVDSASLHILGNIKVHELRLARLDDPTIEIAHFPSAILYHNKEKLLDGELSFRKIELHRPRLRIIRGADGKWNIQGLAAAGKPGQPVPTIVVHQATILFEDRRDQAAPAKLELDKAHLTLINDPLDVVTIDGLAHSELLGKIALHGAWHKQANELTLAIKAQGVRLDDTLLQQVARFCSPDKLKGLTVQGQADVHANVAIRPGSEPAWTYDVHGHVKDTTVRHPELPKPLNHLDARLHFDGAELRVETLTAQSGAAKFMARGVGQMPALDQNFTAALRLEHVEIDDHLDQHLPEKLQKLLRLYNPHGRATLHIDVARRDGQWAMLADGAPSHIRVLPEEISACFKGFPYPLHKISGAIQCILPTMRLQVDLTGHAGTRPVFIKGRWQADGPRIDMLYDITATEVPVDDVLVKSLPETVRKTVEAFHVTGKVDVKAQLRRRPSDEKLNGEYHICLQDGSICWDEFPYPLVNVAGFIDVFSPTHWEFHNFQGTHGDSVVSIRARTVDADRQHAKPGVFVEIASKNLALDADVQTAARKMPALLRAWETFQPSGRANFTAAIDRRGKLPEDLEVRVDVKGPTMKPRFFPYPLHAVAGHFHLHDQRLDLSRLSAQHGDARIYLDKGGVELHPSGALYAELPELQAENLVLDREFIDALPPKLRDAATALRCADPLRLKTQVIVSHAGTAGALPDVYWKGQAWLKNARFTIGLDFSHVSGTIACEGRHNGRQLTGLSGNLIIDHAALYNQPFHDVQAHFQVKEARPELLLLDLKAPIYGGDVAGQISLDFHDKAQYELNLTASQIDLQEFGRRNLGAASKLTGVAIARLHLSGAGSDTNTLDGHGSIDVPNGKLLNLPFLLDLIKFLGLRWPDRTMFEELHARYAIRGRRVRVEHLELFGNAVSFIGKGEINLDGTDLRLDLYPSWARMEQLLPPAIRSMPPTLSKNLLLTVEARGKITGDSKDIRFTKKPMPLLVDPLLNIRDRLLGSPTMELRRPIGSSPPMPQLDRKE